MAKVLTLVQNYDVVCYKEKLPMASFSAIKLYFECDVRRTIGYNTYRNTTLNKEKICSVYENIEREKWLKKIHAVVEWMLKMGQPFGWVHVRQETNLFLLFT